MGIMDFPGWEVGLKESFSFFPGRLAALRLGNPGESIAVIGKDLEIGEISIHLRAPAGKLSGSVFIMMREWLLVRGDPSSTHHSGLAGRSLLPYIKFQGGRVH